MKLACIKITIWLTSQRFLFPSAINFPPPLNSLPFTIPFHCHSFTFSLYSWLDQFSLYVVYFSHVMLKFWVLFWKPGTLLAVSVFVPYEFQLVYLFLENMSGYFSLPQTVLYMVSYISISYCQQIFASPYLRVPLLSTDAMSCTME